MPLLVSLLMPVPAGRSFGAGKGRGCLVTNGAKGALRFRARGFILRSGLRRCHRCDAAAQSLVGALGVVDVVKRVDLGLQLCQRVGQWLLSR